MGKKDRTEDRKEERKQGGTVHFYPGGGGSSYLFTPTSLRGFVEGDAEVPCGTTVRVSSEIEEILSRKRRSR